uniref:Nicotinamidase n=1 Tax=Roseihalotalea indica TaxID=2867963 RepID=A0AA49JHU5_9BACT|nr:bifunctional nicotinamidase/pyrazinamidase [Tunicatimonas sp. TK19036]
MEALILVDIQHDFLPGGALEVAQGDAIIPVANQLQEHFDLVVATQDWHPADHGSFASNHPGKQPFEQAELAGLPQVLWPDHCLQGSPGAGFPETLNMNKVEAIFRKGMDPRIDSYSGFFDNGHKKATGLGDYLKGRNVDTIYVVGLAGDYCVNFTLLDALELGFKAVLIQDGTKPIDEEGFQKALASFKGKGGQVISSREIVHV